MDPQAMDILDIIRTLPHRYPFLLVDRVLELVPGERIKAIKNVTMNEPQFMGHWPDNPVMPGVLILEAMAQAGGIVLLCVADNLGKTPYFAGVDGVRFRRQVRPGDQMVLEATLERHRGDVGRVSIVASVGDEVACEGVFTFALVSDKRPPEAAGS